MGLYFIGFLLELNIKYECIKYVLDLLMFYNTTDLLAFKCANYSH